MAHAQALREAVAGERLQLQRLAGLADGEDAAAGALRRGDHLRRVLGVGIDDGHAVGRQQLGEQPQLGGEIGLHARVIVEVVAAEIGEGRRLQPHAVEPVLVEAVRGGLEGQVRDALGRQLRQRLVQGHGIGRGQRAVDAAVGLDQADGAERGGLVAERGEDLAREVGDRGLAAGAGDGDDGRGLRRRSAPPSGPARGAARRAASTATPLPARRLASRPWPGWRRRPWRPHRGRSVRRRPCCRRSRRTASRAAPCGCRP